MAIPLPSGVYPRLVAVDTTDLYITGDNNTLYKISRTAPVVPNSATLVVALGFSPNSMVIYNTILYLSDSANDAIQQVNLTGSPVVSIFASGLSSPRGVDVSGGYLYTNGVFSGIGVLYKIDINNSAIIETLANVGPDFSEGCTIIGDYLYIIIPNGTFTIVRVDLTDFSTIVDPWVTLNGSPLNATGLDSSIVSYNNNLYISYSTAASPVNFIAEIDTTGTVTNTDYLPGIFSSPNYTNTWSFCQLSGSFYISYTNQTSPYSWPVVYGLTAAPPTCFKEGSQILALKDGKDVYVPIQQLRPGDLVKTASSGYKAIWNIGHTVLLNPGHANRTKDRLYVCSKDAYPELTEDLVITGCHSILVDHIRDSERAAILDQFKKVYITENRYRLPACIDERAKPFQKEGLVKLWHFALEHTDYYMNYGVYANGLLVETCSKRYLKELSNMKLLE
jgi:hypothetical protein